jgi:hypothetical protein
LRRYSQEIVGHLLQYMVTADFNIREELALKAGLYTRSHLSST